MTNFRYTGFARTEPNQDSTMALGRVTDVDVSTIATNALTAYDNVVAALEDPGSNMYWRVYWSSVKEVSSAYPECHCRRPR